MQYVVILACMSMHQIDNVSTVNKVLCQYLNFCRKMFSLCLTCLYMLLNICNVIHISTSLTVQYFFFLVGVVPFWVIMLSSGSFYFLTIDETWAVKTITGICCWHDQHKLIDMCVEYFKIPSTCLIISLFIFKSGT